MTHFLPGHPPLALLSLIPWIPTCWALSVGWMCQASFCLRTWIKAVPRVQDASQTPGPLQTLFWIHPSKFFLKEVTSLRKPYLMINSSEVSLTCTQVIMHFFPILALTRTAIKSSNVTSFFLSDNSVSCLFFYQLEAQWERRPVMFTTLPAKQSLLEQFRALETQMVPKNQPAAPPASPFQEMDRHPPRSSSQKPEGHLGFLPVLHTM